MGPIYSTDLEKGWSGSRPWEHLGTHFPGPWLRLIHPNIVKLKEARWRDVGSASARCGWRSNSPNMEVKPQ